VVHLAVDHAVYHPNVPPLRRTAPYILAVGALQPRKNFVMLMRAFSAICSHSGTPLDLVIAGQRGWMWEAIESEARTSPVADRIHLLGYVPDKELPGLYAGAKVVAFPSLYEGFGIPLLEAMACGIPVVAANDSSLPEVVGDAGLLLEPTDQKQWEDALAELIANDRLRRELRDKGIDRAATFTWERTARETFSVYQQVLNNS
jgi:glycosyltransferase involved in cell wall biosynthesis